MLKSLTWGQQLGQHITFHSKYSITRLRNMLKICLDFSKSEPQYAYKRYAYKKNMYSGGAYSHTPINMRLKKRFVYF